MNDQRSERLDASSRIKDVYGNPVGRDIIDKVLLQMGRSRVWVTNPLTGNLRLSWLGRLTRGVTGPDFVPTVLRLLNSESDVPNPGSGGVQPTWWKQAVFYQIYPRSFADSDGDGVGDLGGVIEHLDYLADLGVDCLWLSPIFDSPNEDNGYDIRDYRAVMSEMGILEQVDELIASCHQRGMRIILDLVVNHTSVEHAWFQQALADPDGAFGKYYFLRPPDPQHSDQPPNNWVSFFSGSAWRWFPEAKRWGLHLFAPGQVDLNWENPAVRDEVAEICRWWFEHGIDGFRLDVINYISKSPGLPPGNEFVGQLMEYTGVEQYFYGPQLHQYLRELRAKAFARNEPHETKLMVGETPGVGIEMGRLLTGADRGELDLNLGFDHLETAGHVRFDDYRYDLDYLKGYLIDYQSRLGDNDWLSLFIENHDNPRMISKIDPDPAHRVVLGKLLGTLELTMRGTPFIFQGQELGAVNQPFAELSQLRDIESLNRYRALIDGGLDHDHAWRQLLAGSRDHARVPMRWDDSPNGGFTSGTPWIVGEAEPDFSVADQTNNRASVLNHYRSLIRLRRSSSALRLGAIEFVHSGVEHYFAWYRTASDERWFIELNLSDHRLEAPALDRGELVLGSHPSPVRGWMEHYESRLFRLA